MTGNSKRAPAEPLRFELQALRTNKGVSLEQIAEGTKISRRFLEAIEAEQFNELPGGVYDTSFIRQYAEAVGFEPSELLAYYRLRTGAAIEAVEALPQPAGPWKTVSVWLHLPSPSRG